MPPSNPYPGPERTRDELLPKLVPKPWIRKPAEPLILKNACIVDPAAGQIIPTPVDIRIEDGHFVEIVYSAMASSPIYPSNSKSRGKDKAREVDLERRFVCPGLIDCHVHVTAAPGVKTVGELWDMPDELMSLRTTYVLKEMLSRGFTTVRDTGGASKALANAIEEGLIDGPRLFQCGKSLSQSGGHGDLGKVARPSATSCCGEVRSIARVVDGVSAVLRATREEIKLGADFIKIHAGGGVASFTDAIETVQFLPEELRAITTTCKQMGNIHTTAHAYTVESINHAIDNGVKGIEHGNLLDEATAKRMAAQGIFLTPTLSCYGIMVRPPFEDFLPEESKKKNAEVMQQGLKALEIADRAGVTVCYGTDLLVSMHALQTEEFTVRGSVLPAATVLRHATTNAAKLLRSEGTLGAVAVGAIADFIILDENPLRDITVLDRPEEFLLAVVKDGRVARSKLAELPAEGLL